METAEHREPYEPRGSRTVLGEPGGETPPGHSTLATPMTTQACSTAFSSLGNKEASSAEAQDDSGDNVVDWIREYRNHHGSDPGIQKVMAEFGMSKSTPWRRIKSA